MLCTELADEAATLAYGAELATHFRNGVMYLKGELGAGKTTLVRGYLRRLGYVGLVKSPTYTLIEHYEASGLAIAHMDLYRVNDPKELTYIGLEDVMHATDVLFVEWPERGTDYLPPASSIIKFSVQANVRIASRS